MIAGSLTRRFSASVGGILLLFALIQAVLFFSLWRYYSFQTLQRTQWDFCGTVAERISPLVKQDIRLRDLQLAMDEILDANLDKEVHILNAQGSVLASFCQNGLRGASESIALDSILRFLEPEGRRNAPLYTADPCDASRQALFSVCPTTISGEPGYVHVVLNSSYAARVFQRETNRTQIVAIILSSCVASFGAALLAYLLFRPLSKRIGVLMRVVRHIEKGGRESRVPTIGDDELSELGRALNVMADEIQQSMDKLERKDLLRRELVENIWHDIRGPVAGLRGLAEVLQSGNTQRKEQLSEGILANADRLTRFLDELRDITDLDLEERKVAEDAVDLADIATELCRGLEQQAAAAEVRLYVDADDEVPLIRGDGQLLSRLIQNLVENALRYSRPKDSVCVRLRAEDAGVRLSVIDTGVGISAEELPFVFERRYQGSGVRGMQSRGLGLSIVKKVAESHGSQIEVESAKNAGTTFSVVLRRYSGSN